MNTKLTADAMEISPIRKSNEKAKKRILERHQFSSEPRGFRKTDGKGSIRKQLGDWFIIEI